MRCACLQPRSGLIKGKICGVQVETIDNPLMKKIRQLDKLVDESGAISWLIARSFFARKQQTVCPRTSCALYETSGYVAKRAGVSFENKYLDTKGLVMNLRDEKEWKDVKLTTLSSYYGIVQNEAHRAWCDAEANAYVYLKLKDE